MNKNKITTTFFTSLLLILCSCTNQSGNKTLPFYGEKKAVSVVKNGTEVIDSIYQTVGPFSFINQFNDTVSDKTLLGKVFLFTCFHTSFQTQLDTLLEKALDTAHAEIGNSKDFHLISLTLDPTHDTPAVLKTYWDRKNIAGKNWSFLTGLTPDSLYNYIKYKYRLTAIRDTGSIKENGGIIHDDKIVLVDKQQRIRGYYKTTQTRQLIEDAKTLLNEDTLSVSSSAN